MASAAYPPDEPSDNSEGSKSSGPYRLIAHGPPSPPPRTSRTAATEQDETELKVEIDQNALRASRIVMEMVQTVGLRGLRSVVMPAERTYMIYWRGYQLEQLRDQDWNEEFWAPAPFYSWVLRRLGSHGYEKMFNTGRPERLTALREALAEIAQMPAPTPRK